MSSDNWEFFAFIWILFWSSIVALPFAFIVTAGTYESKRKSKIVAFLGELLSFLKLLLLYFIGTSLLLYSIYFILFLVVDWLVYHEWI